MKPGEQLSAIFLAELDERARALGRELLTLERQPPGSERLAIINALFRTAHSLKGAAGAMSVELVETICHRLEEIFAAARDGRLELGPSLFQLLFACADAIEQAGPVLRRGDDLAGSPLAQLIEPLDVAIGRIAFAAPGPAMSAEPSSEPKHEAMALQHDERLVRIAAQKLDALSARGGELLNLSRRADARLEELSGLRQSLRRAEAEWRTLARQFTHGPRAAADAGGSGAQAPSMRDRRAEQAALDATHHTQSLRRLVAECESLAGALVKDRRAFEQATGPLDADIRRARMLPFADACDGLERLVRDLSKAQEKPVEFAISGGDIELDRSVIEHLRDPLIHLVRNAIDHGIENAHRRLALGKPAAGRITVRAALLGTRVEITVSDDGAGLDLAAIRERARSLGIIDLEGADLTSCIFMPGFSTLAHVTQVSGRGVGLDAVKTAVDRMRGSVEVSQAAGGGTRFVLSVPLTLSALRVVLVEARNEILAIDAANVDKLMLVTRDKLGSVEGRAMLPLESGPVPIVALADVIGIEGSESDARSSLAIVLLRIGSRRLAVVVDEFMAEQEVVVRTLGPRLSGMRHVAGGTILPTGNVALLLNVADILQGALAGVSKALPRGEAGKPEPAQKKRVLLVDDSMTTRALERSILEIAGYDVAIAADGDEAWQLLLENGADVLVSDIDMPRMDGFALTEAVRGSVRFSRLPVVLVTARESQQDKARGMAVGADAYLVKSAFDQKSLLDTLTRLL
jgi:two-component system, chemotaxis family, sensor kinase CheA